MIDKETIDFRYELLNGLPDIISEVELLKENQVYDRLS